MKQFRYMILFLFIIMFNSCKKKIKKALLLSEDREACLVKAVPGHEDGSDVERIILEAKLADIPIPFKLQPIDKFTGMISEANEQVMMGYYAFDVTEQELRAFYQCEMERLGWKEIISFQGVESHLIFNRPGKLCLVSIRAEKVNAPLMLIVCVGPYQENLFSL